MNYIAVVEDSAQDRAVLDSYLEKYQQEKNCHFQITHFSDGDEIALGYKGGYDLILMDIEMTFMDGMSAAEEIRRADPEVLIIFITNSPQYAIKGYAVQALDYILKPLSYYAFCQRMNHVRELLGRRQKHFLTVPCAGGVQSRGVTPGIKHVAGNDQELHREGLAVFFNEQAFREQTLRAFEGALSNENTMALMQSFNRLGLVWASSSKALCTQVLRKEWGFNGQQETDGVAGGAYKSHFATSLSAGTTTYCIDPTGSAASAIVEEIRGNDDGNMLLNLRDAVKRYHYMLSHTNLINGLSMNATVESIMPWWQIALYAIDVVFVLLMAGGLFMMFRAKRRSEEKA